MSDSASGTAGVVSGGERNRRFSKRRSGQGIVKRKKGAIQRAAWRAWHRQEKSTNDSARGTTREASSRETNERYSEWHGGRVVGGRKKGAIQQVALRACRRWEKDMSATTSDAAGVSSAEERNE
jgi:hypothetical protein